MSERNILIDSHNKDKVNINDNRSTFNTQNSVLKSKQDLKSSKKKKILIISSIALVIVIGIILGIYFGKKSGDQPQPPGPVPPTPSGFNIYQAAENETVITPSMVNGILVAKEDRVIQLRDAFMQKQLNFLDDRFLQFLQPGKSLQVDTQKIQLGSNNGIINKAKWSLGTSDQKQAFFRVEDVSKPRFDPPQDLLKKMKNDNSMRLESLGIQYQSTPFGFKIKSARDSSTLVSTENNTFYMTDKFMQIDFTLASQNLFGFGERNHEFRLSEGCWTMWASGQSNGYEIDQTKIAAELYDDGTGLKQSYSVHPFLLVQSQNPNEYFGMFFRNTAAQSPIIKFNDDGTSTLSYITIGGNLEVNFFLKGTAKQIIAQYHNFIGLPALPPFWALGYQLDLKDEVDLVSIRNSLENFKADQFPFTSVIFDQNTFSNFEEFSLNQSFSKDLQSFIKEIQQNGQKLVTVLPGGMKYDQRRKYISMANSFDSLIKNNTNQAFIAKEIAEETVFLDWMNEQSQEIWNQGLSDFQKLFPFDGVFLDLNENTVFNDQSDSNLGRRLSEKKQSDSNWYTSYPQNSNSTYFLPFIPSIDHNYDYMSLPLNATHPNSGLTQYDVHSLNGHLQIKATHQSLSNDKLFNSKFHNQRKFIMSRSTFAGSGQYGGHIFGASNQQNNSLQLAIDRILNFNVFGIPFTGSSICKVPHEERPPAEIQELCAYWFQVSTFMPIVLYSQDKNWEQIQIQSLTETWKSIVKNSMRDRFKYLRFIYSCLYMSSQYGGSCYDPLYFHFPNLKVTEADNSFIIGNATKISPTIYLKYENQTFQSVFPQGKWLNLQNYSDILNISKTQAIVNLSYSSNSAVAHLREGYLIPIQENSQSDDIQDLNKMGITLIALRDNQGHAKGTVFLDDGETISDLEETAEEYQLLIQAKSVINLNKRTRAIKHEAGVDKILIADASDLADVNFACFVSKYQRQISEMFASYDPNQQTLSLTLPQNDFIDLANLHHIHFGQKGVDINLCSEKVYESSQYKLMSKPDLSSNNFTVNLNSSISGAKEIQLTLTLLDEQNSDTPILYISWNYAEEILAKTVFKVPQKIINSSQNTKLSTSFDMEDFVTFGDLDKGEDLLTFWADRKTSKRAYSLSGFVLDRNLNVFEGKAYIDKSQKSIIGLGQESDDLYLKSGVYSMWESQDEQGTLGSSKITEPFFMGNQGKFWYGVLVNLAAAQDWWIDNSKPGFVGTKVMAASGTGELYIVLQSSATDLLKRYHQDIVGTPQIIPYWALGWNQGRQGYKNTIDLQEVIDNYKLYNLPLDAIWSDIDYLDNNKDFKYDQQNFKSLPNFVKNLHDNNQKYVPIIESGIARRPNQNYEPYDIGVEKNIFLKYSKDGGDYIGQGLPNDVVFPDFTQNATADYWVQMLNSLQEMIPFDGIWFDERTNFCNGVCYSEQERNSSVIKELRYMPTGKYLENKAISLDAYHPGSGAIQLDTHSLYGTMETIATNEWFQQNKKRSMIISRSAFSGQGKFGQKSLRKNEATAYDMGQSFIGIMQHNIFGIPFVGSDICGLNGNTTAELCARWHVAGSFFPFSRNHNSYYSIAQEPWEFQQIYEGSITYLDIMRNAIRNKYSLAKYYYTQLFQISRDGGTFIYPLFFLDGADEKSFENQQQNMMLGEALKLSINSNTLGQNTTEFYFPDGTWCNLFNKTEGENSCLDGQNSYNRSSKAYQFDVHLKDGFIVPLQDAQALNINSIEELLQNKIDLHINPSCGNVGKSKNITCDATGTVVNDDGITPQEQIKNVTSVTIAYNMVNQIPKQATYYGITFMVEKRNIYHGKNNFLSSVQVHNANSFFPVDGVYEAFYKQDGAKDYIKLGETFYDETSNRMILKTTVDCDISVQNYSFIDFRLK